MYNAELALSTVFLWVQQESSNKSESKQKQLACCTACVITARSYMVNFGIFCNQSLEKSVFDKYL